MLISMQLGILPKYIKYLLMYLILSIKFFETIFLAIIHLSAALYLAFMTIAKFPVIEFGKESKSKKDSDESNE